MTKTEKVTTGLERKRARRTEQERLAKLARTSTPVRIVPNGYRVIRRPAGRGR
jgi:hypothetical protein